MNLKYKLYSNLILFLITVFFINACGLLPNIYVLDDPLTKDEHLTLGLSYEKNSELNLAEKEYRYALPLIEAKLYLANLLFAKKEYKEAEKLYRQILKEEKTNAQAANNLAWLLYTKNKKIEEAVSLAQSAINNAKTEAEKFNYQDTLIKINHRLNM